MVGLLETCLNVGVRRVALMEIHRQLRDV